MTEPPPEFQVIGSQLEQAWFIRRNPLYSNRTDLIGPYPSQAAAQIMADALNAASPYREQDGKTDAPRYP